MGDHYGFRYEHSYYMRKRESENYEEFFISVIEALTPVLNSGVRRVVNIGEGCYGIPITVYEMPNQGGFLLEVPETEARGNKIPWAEGTTVDACVLFVGATDTLVDMVVGALENRERK